MPGMANLLNTESPKLPFFYRLVFIERAMKKILKIL